MMKPWNSLPRVPSSLWHVGIFLGFTTLLSASCRLAAFQLSFSLYVVFIRSSSILHFQVLSPSHSPFTPDIFPLDSPLRSLG